MSAEMDPRLREWVDIVDHCWQRAGVAAAERVRMRSELEADLAEAMAGGASVDDLVAVDPADFAADVAEADEVPTGALRPEPDLTDGSLLGTVLAGAAVGAVLALFTVYRYGTRVMDSFELSYEREGLVAIGLHVVAACLCVATALAAVAWQFRFSLRDELRRALVLTGVLFVLGGLVSVAPTIAFARSVDYRADVGIVLIEVAIVVACCSLGLLAARRLVTRPLTRPRSAPR